MGLLSALRRSAQTFAADQATPPAVEGPAVDRRGFVAALVRGMRPQQQEAAQAPPMARAAAAFTRQLRPIPVLRPPGALPEATFLDACTRCGDCIRACPHQAIVLAPARLRSAAGTPMVDPAQNPCAMCADTPCISACTPQALVRPPGSKATDLRLGTAAISRFDCIAGPSGGCFSCSERCPVPGAIRLESGRPQIVEAVCTGCGTCQAVCPAPVNAIRITPKPLEAA